MAIVLAENQADWKIGSGSVCNLLRFPVEMWYVMIMLRCGSQSTLKGELELCIEKRLKIIYTWNDMKRAWKVEFHLYFSGGKKRGYRRISGALSAAL